jgi:sRNA-binding regulator protein Hfq
VHRKLVRPSLETSRRNHGSFDQGAVAVEEPPQRHRPPSRQGGRRPAPPEHTGAEEFYYVKQMANETPLVFVLHGGERIRGRIEWYDKLCVKVTPDDGGPAIMIFKHTLRYLYKQEEEEA